VVDLDAWSATVREILDRHVPTGERVTLVGHSYGTFLCTYLLRTLPERVGRVAFVDPLMLTVALYETADYLFYRPPRTLRDWIFYVFVRTNLPLATVLQRHFVWYNMVLKLDEIPADVDVCVAYATGDHLVAPGLIDQLVADRPTHVIRWVDRGHAEGVADAACVRELVHWFAS
jgi:pimeloyl-ACP methyl ester carboxylesterase